MRIPESFIRAVPKTDLHVHLDGSLRLTSLIEMARERGIALPSSSEEGMRELVFKPRYANLAEYLEGFRYTTAVLQDPAGLQRAAYELALDNADEGVRYVEVRFAPQLHVGAEMDVAAVCRAVDDGLARAAAQINARPEVCGGVEPPFRYGLIVCAMRMFTAGMSRWFQQLLSVHRDMPADHLGGLASYELARAVVRARDDHGLPIVGFDLAGLENGYPAIDHVEAYRYVHRHFMKKTVHAGEAYGPESIFQAITALHTDRIGHGYHLFSQDLIRGDRVADRQAYVRHLAEYIADRRITLEVCITSNLQTNPSLRDARDHVLREMLEHALSVTLCTDNRLVSSTTVTREIMLAVEAFDLDRPTLKNLIVYGFKRSFYPGTYLEKRGYVRQAIDRYEQLEREHLADRAVG